MESAPTYELATAFSEKEASQKSKNSNNDASEDSLQLKSDKKTSLSSVGSQYADMNRGSIKSSTPPVSSALTKLNVTTVPDNVSQKIVNSPNGMMQEDKTPLAEHTYTNVKRDNISENNVLSANEDNIYINCSQPPPVFPVYTHVNRINNDSKLVFSEPNNESDDDIESMTHEGDDRLLVDNALYVSQS